MNRLIVVAALAAGASTLASRPALAQAPGLIPVQGFLSDADGNPLTGSRTLVFSLYTSPTSGAAVFSETFSIDTPTGAFGVALGTSMPVDLAQVPENGSLWLGLSVDGGAELSPRLQFGTAPYAARAAFADDASTLQGLGIPELASQAAQAVADSDLFVLKSGDTIDGDLVVDGDAVVNSTNENDGTTAPLTVVDANFDDELFVDSDEMDSTSVLGLNINTNVRSDTRVGNNVVVGNMVDFEDSVVILTRIVARLENEGTTQALDLDVLESYCGDIDGCTVTVIETGFDDARPELRRAAGPALFMYERVTGRWSVGDGRIAGLHNGVAREVILDTGECRFEDDISTSGGSRIDLGVSNRSAPDCAFTIED